MTADATGEQASPLPAEHTYQERADAARNRAKILTVAEHLVHTRGVRALSMNEVATAAGVGVGTVYRRFGDQAGLVEALMNQREHELQQGMAQGPPPLGPGASAPARIRAFLHAYVDLLDTYAPLMASAEASMSSLRRYRTGPYAAHHRHLAELIGQEHPDADTHYLADALLAPLAAGLFTHQRHQEGLSIERIKAGLDALLAGLGHDENRR